MFKYILIIALLAITATCQTSPWRVVPPTQYDTSPGLINARNFGLTNIIAELFSNHKVSNTSGWHIIANNSISTYNTTKDIFYMFNLTLHDPAGDLLYTNFTIDVNRTSTNNTLTSNWTNVVPNTTAPTTTTPPATTTPLTSYYCNITLFGKNFTTVGGKSVATPISRNYQLRNNNTQIWVPIAKSVMQELDYFTYGGTNCSFKALLWHTLNFSGGFQSNIIKPPLHYNYTISSDYRDTTLSYKFHYPIPGDPHFA